MISGWEAVDSRIGGRASHGPLFLGSVTLSGVSNNADAVKYFLSVVIRALRGARHFALAE